MHISIWPLQVFLLSEFTGCITKGKFKKLGKKCRFQHANDGMSFLFSFFFFLKIPIFNIFVCIAACKIAQ